MKTNGIELTWRVITPKDAEALLESSTIVGTTNRAINKQQVGKLAADMKSGNFIENATPIKFNRLGGIIDGQHRLKAVVESGISQRFLLATGCSDQDVLVQDIGVKRSLQDMEYILRNGTTPITNLTYQYYVSNTMSRGLRTSQRAYSNVEKKAFFDKHQEVLQWIQGMVGSNNPGKNSVGLRLPATVMAVIGRAYYSQDKFKLEEFVQRLQTGYALPGEEGAALLRTYIIRSSQSRFGGYGMRELYGCTLTALNAFLNNRSLKLLRPSKTELYFLPEEISGEVKAAPKVVRTETARARLLKAAL